MNEPRCIYCGSHLNIDDPHAMGCPLSPAIRYRIQDDDDDTEPFGVPTRWQWAFVIAMLLVALIGAGIQIWKEWQ